MVRKPTTTDVSTQTTDVPINNKDTTTDDPPPPESPHKTFRTTLTKLQTLSWKILILCIQWLLLVFVLITTLVMVLTFLNGFVEGLVAEFHRLVPEAEETDEGAINRDDLVVDGEENDEGGVEMGVGVGDVEENRSEFFYGAVDHRVEDPSFSDFDWD